jgi:hypothetical protein
MAAEDRVEPLANPTRSVGGALPCDAFSCHSPPPAAPGHGPIAGAARRLVFTDIPVLDDEGNPVLDEEGNLVSMFEVLADSAFALRRTSRRSAPYWNRPRRPK